MTRRPTRAELELFRSVLHDVRPLRKEALVLKGEGERPPAPLSAGPPTMRKSPPRGEAGHAGRGGDLLPFTGLDARRARRLRRGAVPIDATLDLHGMSRLEAERALHRFLAEALAQGARHVRIITGKGARSGEGMGVLRSLVPELLARAPLRHVVRGLTVAGPGQGGEGALIVALKRPR